MQSPPTPLHPAGDVEINDLPSVSSPAPDLELNPDLYDDDEDDTPFTSQDASKSPMEVEEETSEAPINLWTIPFDDAYKLLKVQFAKNSAQPKITEAQQSKFINYLDLEILQVQRRFIKNQSDTVEVYSLTQLLQDVASILDLIWYLVNSNNRLYGQEEYYIRIIGDLEDWVAYYVFPTFEVSTTTGPLIHLFNFFQSLDTRMAFLIDGYQVGNAHLKLSATELIRLAPIVTRLRMEIVQKLDPTRARLTHAKAEGSEEANDLLNVLDVEIGRLFEGILERS